MGKKLNFAELVEIELSISGVDRFVKPFDYSDQEWAEMKSALTSPLTEDVRKLLRRAGTVYLALHSAGREFLKQQELTSVANRANIRRLADELHEQLSETIARIADDRKYRQLRKLLRRLRDSASISAKSPPLLPREEYYREIFGVWVDIIGGRLRVSRDTENHKLGGPLVRFFQAVAHPVLGNEAPKLESISQIVDREKQRRTERRKGGRQTLAETAGSIEVAAPGPDASGNYTELGPFRTYPGIPFDKQVHDYVVERGRTTGIQHMVAVHADGTVLAHASGNRNGFVLPTAFVSALNDPSNKIIVHRNDPSNSGLSNIDISLLASPGLEAIWRHGHGGNVARGALTPEGRAILQGSTTEEARLRLFRIAEGIGFRLYDALQSAIRARKISIDRAKMIHSHLVNLTLLRAGILAYRSETASELFARRRARRT